jgi:RNA polymerase sigma factor (sigma-70 family)
MASGDFARPEPDFDALCREEWHRLVGFLSLYTGDRESAEDLAQEALARTCRDWARVKGLDAPARWLWRVAINLANSQLRRRAAFSRARRRLQAIADLPGDAPDPAVVIAVRAAVSALPPKQRSALTLRYFAELSVRETAEVMGCPEGTVKRLTNEAITQLRRAGLLDDTREGSRHGHCA